MNPYRHGILAPGVRDNDWAHTPYDDMYLAIGPRGARRRVPGALSDVAPASVAVASAKRESPPSTATE